MQCEMLTRLPEIFKLVHKKKSCSFIHEGKKQTNKSDTDPKTPVIYQDARYSPLQYPLRANTTSPASCARRELPFARKRARTERRWRGRCTPRPPALHSLALHRHLFSTRHSHSSFKARSVTSHLLSLFFSRLLFLRTVSLSPSRVSTLESVVVVGRR